MQIHQAVACGSILLDGAAAEAACSQRPVASAVRNFLKMSSGKAASPAHPAKREAPAHAPAKASASTAANAAAEAAERRYNHSSRAQLVSPLVSMALMRLGYTRAAEWTFLP